MQIEARPVELAEVGRLRDLYRAEANCQIIHDSFLPRQLADPYLLLADGRIAGYGSFSKQYGPPRILEFYTVPAMRGDALGMFRELLASGVDWDGNFEFMTRSLGPMRAKRKTVLFHALLHAIRHYAQLATLMRQHGIKPGWQMDYLAMGMEPA